ncbi:hypothetical protein KJW59_22225, partial [Enterococcus faecium]|nr:hypothetical protein [Enterococcus faecium]
MSLKTLYRKRTVIWPFYFYTIIRTLSFLAPSKLDFGQIKATGLTQEAFGQMDIQEKLWIYDQRETKN